MNRTILYYPSINIPDTNWLKHALLYWDEVSSIVPDTQEIKKEFSEDIHYLIQEEQFRPINPEELTFRHGGWDSLRNFENEFKEVVLGDSFQRFLNPRPNSQNGRIGNQSIQHEKHKTFRIHRNKTTMEIFDFLIEQGLGYKGNNHEWLLFEEKTALLYMSLLAKYLADIDPEHTTIGTNLKIYEKLNFSNAGNGERVPVISFNLQQLIPTPRKDVSLNQIISFKRRREDNLLHFRRMISGFQSQISQCSSQGELKETVGNFKHDLRLGVIDIKSTMRDSGLLHKAKTFTALLPLVGAAAMEAGGYAPDISEINIPLTGLGAAYSAVKLIPHFIEVNNQRREVIRNSPYSYLIQAEKTGIFNL